MVMIMMAMMLMTIMIMMMMMMINGAFVALGDTFDSAPSDRFFDFSFPSYGRFGEGDPPTQQKVLPTPPHCRPLIDSNSPSALSARAR